MAETVGNKPYVNFVLENEIEDQLNSHLDHVQFCTVDNTLTGKVGMEKHINRYYAKVITSVSGTESAEVLGGDNLATEKVDLKEGNSKWIEADYSAYTYRVLCAQNTGKWYDEEGMEDGMVPEVIIRNCADDLFNTMNADVMAEFAKTTNTITLGSGSHKYFDAFVDAQAGMPSSNETTDAANQTFALVNKADYATFRKSCYDDLKYIEAFARAGYIGHLAGTPVFVDNIATAGTIILATKKAVTLFNKKGIETELFRLGSRSSADADIRKNTLISRKYYLAALTDERYAFKIA